MDIENVIFENLIRSTEKEKLEVAKEKLKTMSGQQLSKLISEKITESKKIFESYDVQYYNIVNEEKNKELKQKMIDELGRMAFAKRQTLENEFLDKILNL